MDFDLANEIITPVFQTTLTIGNVAGVVVPTGTTAERPGSPISGTLRYNSTTTLIEFFQNGSWINIGTVSSINISGGTTGLIASGGPITSSGTITLSGAVVPASGGVPVAGNATQVLTKVTGTDYDVAWQDPVFTNTDATLYRVSNTTTASDPGPGRIRWNNSTQPSATEIYIDALNDNGTDITLWLLRITPGTVLWIQTQNNSNAYQRWQINSITNNTGWFTFGVSLLDTSGISFANNSSVVLSANIVGVGSVTSVALALPSFITVSGSPVTSSGTLTGTLATQSANTFFVGPLTGGPAAPTFRTVGIDELSDVVITAPTTNQVIAYSGSNWVNTGAVGANATGTVGVSPSGGGTAWTLISGNRYRADFVHNLGTTNVVVTCWDTNTNEIVIPNNVATLNANTVRVTVTGNTRTIKVVVVANGQSIVAGGSTPSSVITAYEGVTISTAATRLNFQGQAVGVVDAGAGTTNITIGSRFTFFANSLDTPVNPDFAVNAIAATVTDPTFASLNVRSFSNITEQGVACLVSIPSGATTITVKIRGRAQTAPGVASVVQPRLYTRLLPNNAVVGAWSPPRELTNISIPTNANFQYYLYSATLASLTLTANNLYQFEFTRRVAGVVGTNLAANFLVAEITVEFA